jgi:hypothetical protein
VLVLVLVIVIEDIQERSILWNDKSIEKREKLREKPHVVLSVDYDYEHEHDAQARGGARAAST